MWKMAAVLLSVTVIGCGNSEMDQLRPGSSAQTFDYSNSRVSVFVGKQREKALKAVEVPPGTKVLVLEDDELNLARRTRMVEVRVEEGEQRDAIGFVARANLRPWASR